MSHRVIFHVDMDAFFASIEVVKNPSLSGKALIVGGQPTHRGVVSTCSYEARKFGVHSAMPLSEAKRLCPHAIFLDGDFGSYRDYSNKIHDIFHLVTSNVEMVSIDEAYLDLTGCSNPQESAQNLKKLIFDTTKLPCSIGIASNKLVAKIASGKAKPNGIFYVPSGQEESFLAPLPVSALPGIGEKTAEILKQEDIYFIHELQSMTMDELIHRYGARGYYFYLAVHGKDNRPVETTETPPKSIGAETTFEEDQEDKAFLKKVMSDQIYEVWERLKKHSMHTRSICLKLRNDQFYTITRSTTLFADTQNLNVLTKEFSQLFEESYKEMLPIRLIGISLKKLTDEYWQPSFLDWE